MRKDCATDANHILSVESRIESGDSFRRRYDSLRQASSTGETS